MSIKTLIYRTPSNAFSKDGSIDHKKYKAAIAIARYIPVKRIITTDKQNKNGKYVAQEIIALFDREKNEFVPDIIVKIDKSRKLQGLTVEEWAAGKKEAKQEIQEEAAAKVAAEKELVLIQLEEAKKKGFNLEKQVKELAAKLAAKEAKTAKEAETAKEAKTAKEAETAKEAKEKTDEGSTK